MRAAGINVKGGLVYLAVLDPAPGLLGRPAASVLSKIAPSSGLEGAERLHDFTIRIRQELQTGRVETVGLVDTRAPAGWNYRKAYARVTAICAVMAAATEIQASYATIKTTEISRIVGAAADKLQLVAFDQFGLHSRPTFWTTGLAEAYAVGATALARGYPK